MYSNAQDIDGSSSSVQDHPTRILLVEDHADTAAAMRMLLERKGYHVMTAHTFESATSVIRDGSFDLLICDISLPDGSGLDIMRMVRETHAVPGIAVSGFGTEADIRRSKEAGFFRHFTKPVNIFDLFGTIRNLVH
jgi:DNA-binding response OmpR family regulator